MDYFEKKTIRRCEREEGFFSDFEDEIGFLYISS